MHLVLYVYLVLVFLSSLSASNQVGFTAGCIAYYVILHKEARTRVSFRFLMASLLISSVYQVFWWCFKDSADDLGENTDTIVWKIC